MRLSTFLAIITAAIALLMVIAIWVSPSNEDFRTNNTLWNGMGDMTANYPALPLRSLSDLPESPEGTTLVLIPYLTLTPAELAELKSFVTGGGALVLADDYGYGNSVLEYLGLSARFSGQALLDPLSNYKNKRLPRISNLRPAPLTAKAESLILNHATCLIEVDDSETLALSSAFSFLDTNGNGTGDPLEPVGPFPVISQHRLGKGQVILISDPSIFINSMQSIDSNARLIENIATIAAGSLFIDQSHLPPSDISHAQDLLARVRSYLATPLGTSGLVILALAITMMPVWRKHNQPSPKGDENDKT